MGGSKKLSAEAGALLLLVVAGSRSDATLLTTGRDTVGPARLLESLFDETGTSNPRSASFTTAGPTAPDSVERSGGVEVVVVVVEEGCTAGAGGAGVDRGRLVATDANGKRRLMGPVVMPTEGLDPEGRFELEEDEDEPEPELGGDSTRSAGSESGSDNGASGAVGGCDLPGPAKPSFEPKVGWSGPNLSGGKGCGCSRPFG